MIYQYEILEETKKRSQHPVNFVSKLFEILSSTHKDVYQQDCKNPNAIDGAKCRGFRQNDVYVLKNKPRVFSFNFAWNNTGVDRTNALDIIQLLSMIPNVFNPRDFFELEKPSDSLYFFKGMICFFGLHYFAYFRDFEDTSSSNWVKYNDKEIKRIGDWDDVVQECVKELNKPILLLFEELKTKDAQYQA